MNWLVWFSEHTFNAIPITVFFVPVIEAGAVKRCLQPRCRIDEKDRVIDEMFVAESSGGHLGDRFGRFEN